MSAAAGLASPGDTLDILLADRQDPHVWRQAMHGGFASALVETANKRHRALAAISGRRAAAKAQNIAPTLLPC